MVAQSQEVNDSHSFSDWLIGSFRGWFVWLVGYYVFGHHRAVAMIANPGARVLAMLPW